MKLRTRLLLLILFAVVPAFALLLYEMKSMHDWDVKQAESATRAHALQLAADVDTLIYGLRHVLVTLAKSPAVHPETSAGCNDLVAAVQREVTGGLTLGVSDRVGRVFCNSAPIPPGASINWRRYFQDAIKRNDFVIGEYAIGGATKLKSIHFAYPVRDADGTPVGVVFAPLSLDWLQERVEKSLPSPQASVLIADGNGIVLVSHPDKAWVGKPLPDAWQRVFHATELGSLSWRPERAGGEIVTGFVPAAKEPAEGLFVAVSLPREQLVAPIRAASLRVVLLMALVIVLGVLGATWLSRRWVERPVAVLVDATSRWRAGDYTVRTGLRGREEMGLLGAAFDDMASAIERREREQTEARLELTAAKEAAQQADAAKTHFLAAASHDLRQPLQSMTLTIEMLDAKSQDPALAPLIARLRRAAGALTDLLNALLDLSQLDAGLVKPRRTEFELSELFGRMAEEFADIAAGKRLTLRIEPCTCVVASDETLLARVVRNLVSNAVKFTPEGGEVRVRCEVAGEHARICVTDTGVGIPEERQAEVFAPFAQLDNPSRDRAKGLGLGLAIVDRMCRLLGHEITLRSTPGVGTTFTVTVPLGREPRPVTARQPELTLDGRALVVEDEPIVAEATAELLRNAGAHVVVAHCAEEAALAARDGELDLVVADHRLPGASGLALVRELLRERPGVRAALLTGDTFSTELRDLDDARVAVMYKPVTGAALAKALSEIATSNARSGHAARSA